MSIKNYVDFIAEQSKHGKTLRSESLNEEGVQKHPKGGVVALTHEGEHVTHFTDAKSKNDVHHAVVKHLVAHHGFDERHARKAHKEVSHEDPDYLAHPKHHPDGHTPTHTTTTAAHAKHQAKQVSDNWGGPRKKGDKGE